MNEQKVIEETQEICTLCGGRGQERNYLDGQTTSANSMTTCRQCQGVGDLVTKRVVRYTEVPAHD